MLNESEIIETLRAAFTSKTSVIGIGDDCAVLPLSASENYVVTKDILVEHRHFRLATTGPASLGRKALHVNLSDIAAMGAKPLFVLLGIALPTEMDRGWVKKFLSGFTSACKQEKVRLVGGDTTASDRDLFISVTVIGKAKTKNLKLRSGAKAGDVVCVAGVLGEAYAGFVALEKKAKGLDAVKAKHLRPLAKTAEGIWLGAEKNVHAMMDVSDGLHIDLTRMIKASDVGAAIDVEKLKPSAYLLEAVKKLRLDPIECMLAGGEDCALLITIAGDKFESVAKKFRKKFGYPLMNIGRVVKDKSVKLSRGGKTIPFAYKSFSHFGEL